MAQIAGTRGPAAAGQISRQQNAQSIAQQRVQDRTRAETANAGQNNTASAGQAGQAAVPANQQNGPEQNVGRNVNIVV